MLIELITPLMLATAPMSIDVPDSKYDHATQISTYNNNTKTAQYRPPTSSGTRTFLANGQPYDNDND
jgi:hypothetical protein